MSKPGEMVTINAEWLIARLEALEATIQQIRYEASQGVLKQPSPFTRVKPRPPSATAAHGININLIDWKRSNKAGGGSAGPGDGWAWAFAYSQDGKLLDEAVQLVQEIERYEKVEVDGFEITLGGRDKNLLNRKKIKQ